MSKALAAFTATTNRVIALAEYQTTARQTTADAGPVCDDMIRACVVLSVAAMDTYFTRKFAYVLVPFLKRKKTPGKHLVALLSDAGLDTEQALLLLGMDRPYRRILTLIRAHLSSYTTQRFNKIDELFACLGVSDLSKHAEGKTKKKTLLKCVRILVERRHDIAHEGDLNDHGKLHSVDPVMLVRRIRHLMLFVAAADDIIDSAVKPKRKKKAAAEPVPVNGAVPAVQAATA